MKCYFKLLTYFYMQDRCLLGRRVGCLYYYALLIGVIFTTVLPNLLLKLFKTAALHIALYEVQSLEIIIVYSIPRL